MTSRVVLRLTLMLTALAPAWLEDVRARVPHHVFVNGDPCKLFDDVVYHDGLVARFLATVGKGATP